jgi:hypothetical protein
MHATLTCRFAFDSGVVLNEVTRGHLALSIVSVFSLALAFRMGVEYIPRTRIR